MIRVNALTKEYHKTKVLDNINFTIAKGSIVGIIGSNGAGKSTLISIMASIIKPTQGTVTIDHGRIAYVPQEIALFPNFTVKDNLNFRDTISNNHGKKEKAENIKEIVAISGLEAYLNTKVSKLSGGLKRQVNIALALLPRPDILIMDEPTVGIDISSRAQIIDFIKELSKGGTTIIYVSHHPEEIESLCDQILCLNKGHLVFDGTLDHLRARYPDDNIYKIVLKISKAKPDFLAKGGQNETHHTH